MTLALHGATAAIHDFVAGRAGDFDEVRTLLQAQNAAVVLTSVTRSNARNLAALAQWLLVHRNRIERWCLRWPGPSLQGLAMPRLGMVAPRMLHAAELARRGGLQVVTHGLPICALGPYVAHREPGPAQAYAGICEGCCVQAACEGVPSQYLETFPRDLELRPQNT